MLPTINVPIGTMFPNIDARAYELTLEMIGRNRCPLYQTCYHVAEDLSEWAEDNNVTDEYGDTAYAEDIFWSFDKEDLCSSRLIPDNLCSIN